MQLVNTEDLVLIGPGSEWFWTAFSGLVLAITFVAIYRQLRLQGDAAAIQQLEDIEHEWSSERLARAKLKLLLALEAGATPDALPNRAMAEVGYFWERVGKLVRTGHIDRRLVYEHFGAQVQAWSMWIRPGTLEGGRGWPHFAWLAEALAKLDADRDVAPISQADLAESLAGQISHFREAVEMFEELRSVTVRLTPTPIPVTALEPRPPARGSPTRSARSGHRNEAG